MKTCDPIVTALATLAALAALSHTTHHTPYELARAFVTILPAIAAAARRAGSISTHGHAPLPRVRITAPRPRRLPRRLRHGRRARRA